MIDAADRRKFIKLSINGKPIRLQMDCGSDITIISKSTWCALGSPPTQSTSHAARNASGLAIELVAELICNVIINGAEQQCRSFVSNIDDLDVIGIEWFDIFGLWDIPINALCAQIKTNTQQAQSTNSVSIPSDFHNKFADIFADELGSCTKTKAKLHLKPNARPVYRTKRPVPYAALAAVETELNRLEQVFEYVQIFHQV